MKRFSLFQEFLSSFNGIDFQGMRNSKSRIPDAEADDADIAIGAGMENIPAIRQQRICIAASIKFRELAD